MTQILNKTSAIPAPRAGFKGILRAIALKAQQLKIVFERVSNNRFYLEIDETKQRGCQRRLIKQSVAHNTTASAQGTQYTEVAKGGV